MKKKKLKQNKIDFSNNRLSLDDSKGQNKKSSQTCNQNFKLSNNKQRDKRNFIETTW